MHIVRESQVITDRVKLPLHFDAKRLLEEYQELQLNNFEYYNVIQLRAPAHIVDPSLPVPPPADDYADGSWTDWSNTSELERSPYLKAIIESFRELTDVTLVRLLRLAPKSEVKAHTDPTLGLEVEKSVIRLTIPIVNNEGVVFYLNEKPVPMQPGECWYLKLTDIHQVVNSGDTERVNLTIDMVPNEKLRALIEESC
ncbi:aspartyl/asparaginyl beta-hydroxylase domain-containing protein [uncultured Psychroserpens sp.]|uniref:aspartyl/asparaginyl beta-hydroxylase domain-containing protein n=1 Tax=uncultured Psychroserpens sp. TaxID=255436 RepID=UPI002636340A|nr:aspartyl/asparaginyl beta-hydroxylase domain-containing protein [uncultured Psychroserpens sp.]